jgi:hypothetical protein
MSERFHLPILVSSPVEGRDEQHEPITVGVPLPQGEITDASALCLADDEGASVPLEATVTERWRDGSVRWALLDFQVRGRAQRQRGLALSAGRPTPIAATLGIRECGDRVIVNTGTAKFTLARGGEPLSVCHASTVSSAGDVAAADVHVSYADGADATVTFNDVSVVHRGRLRCAVRLSGEAGDTRRRRVNVVVELQFFAGCSAIRAAIAVHNPRRAVHPGGIWELGDPGSILLREVALRVRLGQPISSAEYTVTSDGRPFAAELPFELYQDSSGGEQWSHVNHVNRNGDVAATFRGYRVRSGNAISYGWRATPSLTLCSLRGSVGIAVEHFWQNGPVALMATAEILSFNMLSREHAGDHELQGGERKTFRCVLRFGDDAGARDARFWGTAPAIARLTPEAYAVSQAIPFIAPAADDSDPRYRILVQAALDGPSSFDRKREAIDEYGWRNFGDIYADHENAFSGEPQPIVSHYNNQYDAIAGFACQFMRTGDARWFRHMGELAAHVRDIDIYHTDEDKAAYNHGLFWHTSHYVAAGHCTHRSYPRHPRVAGGGPSNEHNYTTGLLLHWLMTGEHQSREAVLELAGWVMAMDDGRQNVLRWVCRSATGLASHTYARDFHGPGRGAGHSILALLDGHRVSKELRFLRKAEELIRRCAHPADDIASMQLLDAERRWSYTVYLQALGRYLDYKGTLGEIDAGYAYARDTLVHYATWMSEHEYPYLEKPEILEYPTETWAAQDLRKADVLVYAAGHVDGALRERFLVRAREFLDTSFTTLMDADTRALARPLVLLLSHGFIHMNTRAAHARPRAEAVAHAPPERFVSQRTRAKQRLTAAACLAALLLIAGGVVLLKDHVLEIAASVVVDLQ